MTPESLAQKAARRMAMGVRLMGGDGWRLADDAMSLGYGGLADNDFWKKLEEADAKIK